MQVPSELGKGNADIVSPQAENAIFYNPASLLTPISAYSLGLSYNLLGRRLNELANKISSLKDDKQRQVEEVETLIGKPLHISSFMGGAFIPRPHTGFGFYVHTLANSIVRGRVLLILDMSVVMRSGLIVPVARPFVHRQLVLGIALKPSYKFEHLVHRDAFEIFEDSSIIKPTERGKEGFGLGLDFGLLMVKHFVNRILKLGGSIRNFGGLKYKRMSYLAKPGSAAPSSDKPQVALGGRLQQQVYFGSRFDLTAHYAYLWDDGLDYHHATSHQYGLSFTLFRGLLELSAGRYKNQQSYGLKASLRFLTLYFGFYRDAWGGGGTSAGDGRHFVQLSSTW
ncbi:MAG: hypothetical protein HRU09_10430 [Oligoflexales bacterium]|nr:hypothetical protein [Oligoflexales bacterium]